MVDNSFCRLLWSGTVVNPLCPLANPFCGCCLFGLLPRFLSGLLFFLDETQIWLGDLRVVVVGVPVCFLVYLICLPLWTLLVLVQMSFRLLMLM